MNPNDNIFTLRFWGDNNEINPESFSAKELGSIIIAFEESIRAIIDNSFPSVNQDDVRISLVSIENKSESLAFALDDLPETIQALRVFSKSVQNKTYTSLPDRAYSGLRVIHNTVNNKSCNAELKYKSEKLFTLFPNTELIKPESVNIESDGIIYGELLKIGGDKPRAWLRLDDGTTFSFGLSKEQVENLSPNMYKPLALKGKRKINTVTDNIVGFKLYDIVEYKPFNTYNAIKELRSITNGFWDTLGDNNQINNIY